MTDESGRKRNPGQKTGQTAKSHRKNIVKLRNRPHSTQKRYESTIHNVSPTGLQTTLPIRRKCRTASIKKRGRYLQNTGSDNSSNSSLMVKGRVTERPLYRHGRLAITDPSITSSFYLCFTSDKEKTL